MSISWYECEIITQIHHFGCRGFSVATIYGLGKIAESQGKIREFLFRDPVWSWIARIIYKHMSFLDDY